MNKILLQYYSRKNFGDDLFIRIFCNYFHEYKIYLYGNPFYVPDCLKKEKTLKFRCFHTFRLSSAFYGLGSIRPLLQITLRNYYETSLQLQKGIRFM